MACSDRTLGGDTMKVGDLVSVDIDGSESLCLITRFCTSTNHDYQLVELFRFSSDQSHWLTASWRVRLINEAG